MHSGLAMTTDGLPLGLAARSSAGAAINPTRVPIEVKESDRWLDNLRQSTALFDNPQRCIHIGDRESDI
jgi:hypothetical protein